MNHLLDQPCRPSFASRGLATAVTESRLLFLSHTVAMTPTLNRLVGWPTSELGRTLLSSGVIAVIFEQYDRKEAEDLANSHFRSAIRQEASAIRDAVLDSFAFSPDRLKNIASDSTRDRIAAHAIVLRPSNPKLPVTPTLTCANRSSAQSSAGVATTFPSPCAPAGGSRRTQRLHLRRHESLEVSRQAGQRDYALRLRCLHSGVPRSPARPSHHLSLALRATWPRWGGGQGSLRARAAVSQR
ncbi:hypothetical protein HDA45_003051 [Amycolatopsis umgeniensis]|uniref:Uncharacterized protein n=1 Tax=Amycolatopsis umgeniensis TaxID=336628 RepID=A0A841B390_9PSEU|nr:hypothetical protein [Amycolatopsis umgeniensis]